MTTDGGPPGTGPQTSGTVWWRLVLRVLDEVLVEPVRSGRLGIATMPVPLRVLASTCLGLVGAGWVAMVAVPWWRRTRPVSDLSSTIVLPTGVGPFVAVPLVLGLALVLCGAAHLPSRLLRLGIWAGVLAVLVLSSREPAVGLLGLVAVLTGGGLLAMVLLRRRRPFALWELLVVVVCLCTWTWLWLFSSLRGSPPEEQVAAAVATLLYFTTPLGLVAGAALAEISTSVAVGTVSAVATGRPRLPWLPVLVVGGVVLVVWRVRAGLDPSDLVWSLGLCGLAALGWWGLARLSRGRGSDDPLALWSGYHRVIWGMAAAASVPPLVELALSRLLRGDPSAPPPWLLALGRFSVAELSLAAAGVYALIHLLGCLRPGRIRTAQLDWLAVVVVAGVWLPVPLRPLAATWSTEGLSTVIGVAAVVCAVSWYARGRLSRPSATALTALVLLALVFPVRAWLGDPLSTVMGSSLAAVLVLSSVWQLCTEGEGVRRGSPAFPRVSRLLLFLGAQLLWLVAAGLWLLTEAVGFARAVTAVDLGDQLFGTVLLLTSGCCLFALALQDRRPRGDRAGDVLPPTSPGAQGITDAGATPEMASPSTVVRGPDETTGPDTRGDR